MSVVLEAIGGLAIIGIIAVGVWFLVNNVTVSSQKGRKK